MNPTGLKAFVDPEGDGNPTKIVLNILRSALNPTAARVMAKKLYRRYRDQPGQITSDQNLSWIRANLQDFPSLARQINRELWEETEEFGRKLEVRASEILKGKQIARAGGAFYPCLYFLTRHMAPECIVETGVAAGYSSQALLEGIKHNGKGRLFSTDFPLFRDDDPVHAIGILIDEHLKEFWELHAEGDDLGLPSIVKKIHGVDIFHYDSDKTYAGRALAFSVVKSKLRPDSIFIMDDVQDNSWFHDYVKTEQRTDFAIFQFMGKYVGLAGPLRSRQPTQP
jgi:predicted O-methyltransferase YrrM